MKIFDEIKTCLKNYQGKYFHTYFRSYLSTIKKKRLTNKYNRKILGNKLYLYN